MGAPFTPAPVALPPHPSPTAAALSADADQRRFDRALFALYALLLAYGTLFPLAGWEAPQSGFLHSFLAERGMAHLSKTDLLFNLVIYAPLGFLGVRLTPLGWHPALRVGAAVAVGVLVTLTLEGVQTYLPSRVSSLRDVGLNALGCVAGAWAGWVAGARGGAAGRLRGLRERWLVGGPEGTLGLCALAAWAASELAPFVPWPDRGTVWHGLKPLWLGLTGQWDFDFGPAVSLAVAVPAVAAVVGTLVRSGRPWAATAGFVAAVLALKVPVVVLRLTPEAVTGAVAGLGAGAAVLRLGTIGRLRAAAGLALLAAAVERLRPGDGPKNGAFDWTPFIGQMHTYWGLTDVLEALWPYMVVVYVAARLRPLPLGRMVVTGAVVIGAFSMGVEWLQGHVPGRYPDLTDPLLAVAAWSLPWLHPALRRAVAGERVV
jgi:VanZ family protein